MTLQIHRWYCWILHSGLDVEPSLSDIGHGSDALMARTRLMSPGSQATTSTGLNYLLAEDNDNIRVPFFKR
jgi:hypothetical protein